MEILKYLPEILSFLSGAIAGSFLTIKFRDRLDARGRSTIVNQAGLSAGRDVVGRDKTTVTGDYVKGSKNKIDEK
ncbi:hypothetical protein [uncultured Roseibium sp.]|uniref:hypothetical protein n=1 Tax=uncultured Roseibium sp. TaxID=1936171 RepID=UPI0032170E30